jgi:MoxR-like ATPase
MSPVPAPRDCAGCPSFKVAGQQVVISTKSGAKSYPLTFDACARYGDVLSRPGYNEIGTALRQHAAQECSTYHESTDKAGPDSMNPQFRIGRGDIDAMAMSTNSTTSDRPATCVGCLHWVPANITFKELGWNMGMCAAKGRLIFPARAAYEAEDCGVGIKGPNRTTTDGVRVDTIFLSVTRPNVTVKGGSTPTPTATKVDPRDYPTDREVTPEEASWGIRAWRAIPDPEGLHDPVMLPIFNGTDLVGFDPRETYESGYEEYIDHQSLAYDMACAWMIQDKVPLLIGEAGTGKTMLGIYMAYLMDLPVTIHSIDPQTESYVFFGEQSLAESANGVQVSTFREGEFAYDWDKPGVTVLDELNTNDECAMAARPYLGGSKILRVAAAGYKKHKHLARMLMCTQNPHDNPIYTGVKPLSAAEMSRMAKRRVGLPDERLEREIIAGHCRAADYEIKPETIDKLMQVAKEIRAMIADGALPISWGLRDQVNVALYTQTFSFEKAFRVGVVDGLESNVVDPLLNIVRTVA